MWIRTQDKKELVNVIRVKVGRLYGDKTKKACILGYIVSNGLFSDEKIVTLGNYPSIEDAILEMDNIQKAILVESNSIYQMKSS